MEHLRALIRSIIKESAMLSGPKRIELLRKTEDPDVQRYIAAIDGASSKKELNAINYDSFVPREKANNEMLGGVQLYWTLSDLHHAKEREFSRAEKSERRSAIDAKKAIQTQKKASIAAKIQRGMNNPILVNALDRIGEGMHKSIKSSQIEQKTSVIERYFTNGVFNYPNPPMDDKSPEAVHQRKMRWDLKNGNLSKFFEYDGDPYNRKPTDKLVDNWEHIIERDAQRYADSVVEPWKTKMAFKLGEVIDRKGGAEISLTGTAWNEHMNFQFTDGSNFSMKTQPVYARSKLGKDFVRFPTTFHDVTFADGTIMSKPSSDKMQDEFGISAASASSEK
jgi:hypothetical protein